MAEPLINILVVSVGCALTGFGIALDWPPAASAPIPLECVVVYLAAC